MSIVPNTIRYLRHQCRRLKLLEGFRNIFCDLFFVFGFKISYKENSVNQSFMLIVLKGNYFPVNFPSIFLDFKCINHLNDIKSIISKKR
jgi:hypothetical protein